MAYHDENDFFRNGHFMSHYRGRYSKFWIERFGLIPELPTSFDNANSIYELIAWLQRAFKQLLDDFNALEDELDDFKNALTELLEYLIPELIRRYHDSEEFREKFNKMIKQFLEGSHRDWFKNFLREILKEPDMSNFFKEYLKELLKDPTFMNDMRELLGINKLENGLTKIIDNLRDSGAWNGDIDGNFNPNRNIATGNINVFGGTPDGDSFIRTNNGETENDLVGGI